MALRDLWSLDLSSVEIRMNCFGRGRVVRVESKSVEFRRGKRFADIVFRDPPTGRGVPWNPYLFSATHPQGWHVFLRHSVPMSLSLCSVRVNSEWRVELETQDPAGRQTERIARSGETRNRQCPSDNWRAPGNGGLLRVNSRAFALFPPSLPRDNSIAARLTSERAHKSYPAVY